MAAPSGIARRLRDALDVELAPIGTPGRRGGRVWLMNPRRLEILLAAAAYPGVHLRSGSRLLMQPLPSLRYHVRALVSQGLLDTRTYFGQTALFVPGMYLRAVEPFLVAWEDPAGRAVLRALRPSGSMTLKELRSASGIASGSLPRRIARLTTIEAVRSRDSTVPRFAVTRAWERFEEICRAGHRERLDRWLDLLRREDLHPSAEELGRGRYRIEADGPRARIRFVLPLDPIGREEP